MEENLGNSDFDEYGNDKEFPFPKDELIHVKPSLLLIQIKLYTNSLNDSRFLSKISQYISIESDYVILERNLLEKLTINKNKLNDSTIENYNIESVIYQILLKNSKLEGVIFEIDNSSSYSRIYEDEFQLKYKIIDYELKINCKYRKSIFKLGFVHFNKQLFWNGYFKDIPNNLTNLKGLESIFNRNTFEDNPRTIIKFKNNFLNSTKQKLLNVLN